MELSPASSCLSAVSEVPKSAGEAALMMVGCSGTRDGTRAETGAEAETGFPVMLTNVQPGVDSPRAWLAGRKAELLDSLYSGFQLRRAGEALVHCEEAGLNVLAGGGGLSSVDEVGDDVEVRGAAGIQSV